MCTRHCISKKIIFYFEACSECSLIHLLFFSLKCLFFFFNSAVNKTATNLIFQYLLTVTVLLCGNSSFKILINSRSNQLI